MLGVSLRHRKLQAGSLAAELGFTKHHTAYDMCTCVQVLPYLLYGAAVLPAQSHFYVGSRWPAWLPSGRLDRQQKGHNHMLRCQGPALASDMACQIVADPFAGQCL